MKTIAIDFETANPEPGNACQIGLAWIEGSRVTRIEERLIRPREMRFSFTWVHGITADHVRDAPEFPDVLAEFHDELHGALMLAHNARFDAGVLRGCARAYGLKAPRTRYLCTLDIARKVWPQLKSKALGSVAAHLGIAFSHHNAAEDARACALIALARPIPWERSKSRISRPVSRSGAETSEAAPKRALAGGGQAASGNLYPASRREADPLRE